MRWKSDYPHHASDLRSAPGDLAAVQRFVNTADRQRGSDELASPRAVADWLVHLGWASEVFELSDPDARRVVAVREAVRALLRLNNGERLDAASVRLLDRESLPAAQAVRFSSSGEIRLEPVVGGVDGALGRLFAVVVAACLDGRWPRLKACADPACGAAFYDASPGRSGKWCSMRRCGNRRNARLSRRRRKRRYAQYRERLSRS